MCSHTCCACINKNSHCSCYWPGTPFDLCWKKAFIDLRTHYLFIYLFYTCRPILKWVLLTDFGGHERSFLSYSQRLHFHLSYFVFRCTWSFFSPGVSALYLGLGYISDFCLKIGHRSWCKIEFYKVEEKGTWLVGMAGKLVASISAIIIQNIFF